MVPSENKPAALGLCCGSLEVTRKTLSPPSLGQPWGRDVMWAPYPHFQLVGRNSPATQLVPGTMGEPSASPPLLLSHHCWDSSAGCFSPDALQPHGDGQGEGTVPSLAARRQPALGRACQHTVPVWVLLGGALGCWGAGTRDHFFHQRESFCPPQLPLSQGRGVPGAVVSPGSPLQPQGSPALAANCWGNTAPLSYHGDTQPSSSSRSSHGGL